MTVRKHTIVGISGSVGRPSRTTALVAALVDRIAARSVGEKTIIELVDHAPSLFQSLTPYELRGEGRDIVDLVESADLLVVGTPVYRASMTGALKHLFDLVDHRKFIGKPVALAATGGSQLHGLITEHQLRPLFGFLNALTLPTTVYAVEGDFENYVLTNRKLHDRIERVAEEAALQLAWRDHHNAARAVAEVA